MVTIRDLAKQTGFSISTVSHALNNTGRVSSKTRNKILQIARSTDYIPNSKAVSLSLGKSYSLGIIIPYTQNNDYYDRLITAIISECFQYNYRPTFLPTNYDKTEERKYLNLLAAKEFDGLIFTSAASSYHDIAAYLKYGAIVSCENTRSSGVPYVMIDRLTTYKNVFQELKTCGYQQIACTFSRSPQTSQNAQDVFRVFKKHIKHFTLDDTFSHCRYYQDGQAAAAYFSNLNKEIDCILANSDEIAAGILNYYQTHQLTPPLIIGENHDAWSKSLNLPSIDFQLEKVGRTAVRLCLNKLSSPVHIVGHYYPATSKPL